MQGVSLVDSQYDGVVKADVGECPVHYHHVRVEDFSPQLQQAEHGASVKLCRDGEGKKKEMQLLLQR